MQYLYAHCDKAHSNLNNTTFATDGKCEKPYQKTTIRSLQSSDIKDENKLKVHFYQWPVLYLCAVHVI